jgi:hypothetical protein
MSAPNIGSVPTVVWKRRGEWTAMATEHFYYRFLCATGESLAISKGPYI